MWLPDAACFHSFPIADNYTFKFSQSADSISVRHCCPRLSSKMHSAKRILISEHQSSLGLKRLFEVIIYTFIFDFLTSSNQVCKFPLQTDIALNEGFSFSALLSLPGTKVCNIQLLWWNISNRVLHNLKWYLPRRFCFCWTSPRTMLYQRVPYVCSIS